MQLAVEIAIPAITVLLMGVVGLDLEPADFMRFAQQPGMVLAGLIGPLAVLPPVAGLLLWVLAPPPHIAAGLLLVAACPVGGISNTYSYLAGASTALSVTLTGLSCLLATVTVPLLTLVFEAAVHRSIGLAVPLRMLLTQLALALALPIAVGMVVRRRWPGFVSRREPALRRGAFAALGLLILVVVVEQGHTFLRDLKDGIVVSAAFVGLSGGAGMLVARFAARTPADRFTLAVEFATRNVAIATAVAVTFASRLDLAVFATLYFLTEAPIMMAAVGVHRGRSRPPSALPSA